MSVVWYVHTSNECGCLLCDMCILVTSVDVCMCGVCILVTSVDVCCLVSAY